MSQCLAAAAVDQLIVPMLFARPAHLFLVEQAAQRLVQAMQPQERCRAAAAVLCSTVLETQALAEMVNYESGESHNERTSTRR